MSDKLSRRDFLKLAGAGTLSLAFRKPIETVDKASIEIEQEKTFETDNAIYIPFLEIHTRHNSDQRIPDTKPNRLFIEFVSRTAWSLSRSPFQISTSTDEAGVRFFSEELLDGLDEPQAEISIEAVCLPPELEKQAVIIRMSSFVLPGLTTVASLGIALGQLAKKGEFSKGDHVRIYSSALALLWGISDELTISDVLRNYDKDEDSPEIRNAQNVASRINATVSFAHPEEVIVFMRNIFMASKLITLAEQSDTGDEKPKIAFRMGAAHGAVSDLVKMGKTICHTMLDVYPNNIVRQVIEYNTSTDKTFEERVTDFCKTIVIPVQEARYNTRVKYVVDNELKEYILNRFAEPQK